MKRKERVLTDQDILEYKEIAAESMADAVAFALAAHERKARLRNNHVVRLVRPSMSQGKELVAA